MFMRTYASSRVKRKSFYWKSELQMFLLISSDNIGGPKLSTNKTLWSEHFGVAVVELINCKCGGIVRNEIW